MYLVYLLLFTISSVSFGNMKGPLAWEKILSDLDSKNLKVSTHLFTNSLEDDLTLINQSELAEIEKAWSLRQTTLDLNDLKKKREAKNVFFHQEVQKLNKKLLDSLSLEKKNHVNHRVLVKSIFDKINATPMLQYKSPQESQIGFCFAYALKIHHELRKNGVPPEDILKVFAIGDLFVAKILWKFHVVIAIKDSEAGFLILDPVEKKALPYLEWFAKNASYDIKKEFSRVRFYTTDPTKFLPSSGAYSLELVSLPIYQDFFQSQF